VSKPAKQASQHPVTTTATATATARAKAGWKKRVVAGGRGGRSEALDSEIERKQKEGNYGQQDERNRQPESEHIMS